MIIIGTGTFAKVYLEDSLAVKQTRLECTTWPSLPRHPNLLRLLKTHKKGSQFEYYTRHYQKGDLYRLLSETGKLPYEVTAYMTMGIAKGLEAMHKNGFSHRDVKLENVLLADDYEPILCDFDFSVSVGENPFKQWNRCGSVPYCAPEVINNIEHDPRAADCWSLGVCLYGMYFGRLPFDGKTNAENGNDRIAKRIIDCQYTIPNANPIIVELIRGLLEPNPLKRYTIDQVIDKIESTVDPQGIQQQITRLLTPVGHDMAPPPPRILYMHSNISASECVVFENDHNLKHHNEYCSIPNQNM